MIKAKNKLDKQYIDLLEDIIANGNIKEDRTGTGTLSVFGRTIRHKMSEGFPLLTSKKMFTKGIITELLWFLRGETNIQSLVKEGNNIWVGDAYKHYEKHIDEVNEHHMNSAKKLREQGKRVKMSIEEKFSKKEFIEQIKRDNKFAKDFGELGPVYGKQWRSWSPVAGEINKGGKDQIKELIKNIKENPDSRRLMVNAWNVGELDQMVLPPCHYGFQLYTRELTQIERFNYYEENIGKISQYYKNTKKLNENNIPERAVSLMWNQRSADTFLGIPFNIASYGLLLEIIGKMVNMVPDELIGNLGDTHIYRNHTDQVDKQMSRTFFKLPKLEISERGLDLLKRGINGINELHYSDFKIIDYECHPAIKAPLSN